MGDGWKMGEKVIERVECLGKGVDEERISRKGNGERGKREGEESDTILVNGWRMREEKGNRKGGMFREGCG